MWFIFCLCSVLTYLAVAGAGHHSPEDGRWYYPEFKVRAQNARNDSRTSIVEQTLRDAAGVYKNKTRGNEMGLERTVFITVVAYSEKPMYKQYLHNLLCYTQHHNMDMIVYLLQHNRPAPDREIQQLKDAKIKALTYPDELFWSLLYSKDNDVGRGSRKVDYASTVPSFASHGSLVMLVPVLEGLLHGYNVIFMDVDIALVLDPVPYLTRGRADFVTSAEMRHCPDHYTPTYINASTHIQDLRSTPRPNSMEGLNWYLMEPNTGIMLVRSTEAGIGFYTRWLTHIIIDNELNDQKALIRNTDNSLAIRDCVYGLSVESDENTDSAHVHRATTNILQHTIHAKQHHRAHHRTHLRSPQAGRAARKEDITRAKWLRDYTTLIADITTGRYHRPVKFCFLSEFLFQNGQTAFVCGTRPMYKDTWVLEMNKHGLQSANGDGREQLLPHDENKRNTPRYPVTVHANYCANKTQELNARGLWLVHHSADQVFRASTCRAFNPRESVYGTNNWVDDAQQVTYKRKFMYSTIIVPGALIQSTIGKDVYLIDEHRNKQLIPDADTFAATIGAHKRASIRLLPSAIVNIVPLGVPLVSVHSARAVRVSGAAGNTSTASPLLL